jgi:hypothetical protein
VNLKSYLLILVGSCWDAYFYSYLQVVNRLSITTAGYVLNAYSLSSAVFAPFIGA